PIPLTRLQNRFDYCSNFLPNTMTTEKKTPTDEEHKEPDAKTGNSFLELASSWGSNIGMHGIPNITRSSSVAKKFLWTLLLLAGLCLTVVQIKSIVDKYYSYPIAVARGAEINLPREFPAVTVCNQSPARKSKVQSATSTSTSTTETSNATANSTSTTTMSPAGYSNVTSSTPTSTMNSSTIIAANSTPAPSKRKKRSAGSGYKDEEDSYSGLTSSMYSSGTTRNLSTMDSKTVPDSVRMTYMFLDFYNTLDDDVKTEIGYQISDMLVDCSMGTSYCSVSNFTRFLHPMYGNCYTFNAAVTNSSRVSVKQQGPLFGLTLTLYIDQSDYTYKKLLGSPYSDNCAIDYKTANKKYNMYRSLDEWALPNVCLKTCIQRKTESRCNCSSPKLPPSNITRTPALPICKYSYNSTSKSPNACMLFKNLSSKLADLVVRSDAFHQVMMYNPIVRTQMDGHKTDDSKADFISQNMVKLIVFFADPETRTEISTKGYEITDLLSDMGGQVGLWLGLSVLTLFELIEMLLDFVVLAASKAALRQPKLPRDSKQPPTENLDKKLSMEMKNSIRFNKQQNPAMWVDEKHRQP
uniref:Acid-sensing ion channel 1 n=1 Tax=Macrostomum lignano TaxID=282301 RepID=A0A1I8HZ99_9PLAT